MKIPAANLELRLGTLNFALHHITLSYARLNAYFTLMSFLGALASLEPDLVAPQVGVIVSNSGQPIGAL